MTKRGCASKGILQATVALLAISPIGGASVAFAQDLPAQPSGDQSLPPEATEALKTIPPTTPQEQSEIEEENSDQVADIIVTAQKGFTGESLQKVSLAVTAIDPNIIRQAQITDVVDIGRLAPNVQLQSSGVASSFPNFTIRGIGVNGSLPSLDPGVSLSIDGMPLTFNTATVVDVFDVESIEVLRGPQGVLFGRNATGGAVALRTRRPANEFGAEFTVRLGNFARFDQTGIIEGPLTDSLRAKVAVMHRKRNGLFIDRNGGTTVPSTFNPSGTDNSSTEDQVGENIWLARAIAVFEPSSTFDVTLIGEMVDGNNGGSDSRLLAGSPNLANPLRYGYTPPEFGNEINHGGGEDFTNYRTYRGALEVNWDVGAGRVTSVTGYRHLDFATDLDLDGTPFMIQQTPGFENSWQLTQELRFASNFSDAFRFVAGAFYSNTFQDIDTRRATANTNTNVITYGRGVSQQRAKNYSVFANFDLTAIPRLTLSAGARLTHERKTLDATLRQTACTGPTPYTGCATIVYSREGKWTDVSPRIAASYQFNDDVMAYGSWSKGFRSGAFNIRASAATGLGPSEPEQASAYEIGLKSSLFGNRARFNVTAFKTNYDDIIRIVTGGSANGFVQDIINAATATIEGVELETEIRPGGGFGLTAAVGWTNASFEEFDLNQDGVSSPEEEALEFDRVPEWTVSVAPTYDLTVDGVGRFSARVGYSYRSSQFSDVQNNPLLKQDAYSLWDASLSYRPQPNLQILLYGRNITDEDQFYDFGAQQLSATLNQGLIAYGGSRRTYGVEFSVNF